MATMATIATIITVWRRTPFKASGTHMCTKKTRKRKHKNVFKQLRFHLR